jgi:hypothetical protein
MPLVWWNSAIWNTAGVDRRSRIAGPPIFLLIGKDSAEPSRRRKSRKKTRPAQHAKRGRPLPRSVSSLHRAVSVMVIWVEHSGLAAVQYPRYGRHEE